MALCLLLVACKRHEGATTCVEEVELPPPPDGGVVVWNGWAGEFVRDYCVSCHSPFANSASSPASCGRSGCHQAGDPRIAADFDLQADVVARATAIRCGIATTQDPSWGCGTIGYDQASVAPKDFPLCLGENPLPTDEQRALFLEWLDAGMP